MRFYVQKLLTQNGYTSKAMFPPRVVFPGRLGAIGGREERSIVSTIVESVLGFEGIHDCLFRQSQPWAVEDSSMSDIWYIGILAHTDSAFRNTLRHYLDCYRSPFSTLERMRSEPILQSTFEITTIVNQIQTATFKKRSSSSKHSLGREHRRCLCRSWTQEPG